MIWLKSYQNNIDTTSSLDAKTSLFFYRSKKTAKQLCNSYRICSDHFRESQYMEPAHTSLIPRAIPPHDRIEEKCIRNTCRYAFHFIQTSEIIFPIRINVITLCPDFCLLC